MAGTILITGANGSLALELVKHLLTHKPKFSLLLTVRNSSDHDSNTNKLRQVLSDSDPSRVSIRELDLASLEAVKSFASTVVADIAAKKLVPLAAIVCNAYYWNLNGPLELTQDGIEKSFQINHLSHAALVLRLLASFGPGDGRIVLFSSDAHWTKKNSLEKFPPAIPEQIELLVRPAADKSEDDFGWGFQRYANSKLAITMWMYALNRHLQKDPNSGRITAVAINPGNLSDSRALRTNTPQTLVFLSKFVIQPLRPLLRLSDPTMRTAAEAAVDVAILATNKAHSGECGFFTLLKKEESSPDSKLQGKQEELWAKTLEWAGTK